MVTRFALLTMAILAGAEAVPAQQFWPDKDWETATPTSQGMSAEGLEKAKVWLETHNSKSGLVIRHGRIVAEWYFGGADRQSKFAAYSTTKSLSSMATGIAIADQKLQLNDTVGKFIPEVSPEGKRAITVKQMLSMTSGVHNNPGINDRDDLFSYALRVASMDHQPGAKWDYNNTGLAILSPVFHKATGKQIDDFLNERVFRPIGITADDLTWDHREGFALPYSGCNATARALGRIGLMVHRKGKWRDKQIVPAEWLAESVAASQEHNKTYGYLWWNNTTGKWPHVPQDTFAALGRWDNDILIVPSLDLIVVRQSDLTPGEGFQIAEYFRLACDAVEKD